MRMSQLFSKTLREAPSEAEVASHQLLLRAGFIRQLAAGVFSYLPLARRTMNRIETIIREEMDAIGGQEITMPVIHPADLWQETGRWYQIDAEMGRFKDRSGRDMVLGMTHEEVVADLVRKEIRSYRQLPQLVYQIQTKWRDDPRPRAGLIRVREFTMKDSYSLDTDEAGLKIQYERHYRAYFNIFRRAGLPVIAVASDTGMMGGKVAHEYMYLTPIGEDTLLLCDGCGYAANRQIATFRKTETAQTLALPVEKVATPDCKTIAELARFLGVEESQTAKAVFMVAELADAAVATAGKGSAGGAASPAAAPASDSVAAGSVEPLAGVTAARTETSAKREQFVFAVIRGDMEINETKLANAVRARGLRPATEDEIRAVGAVPGYASPVGLRDVLVVVDELVTRSSNLVAGANESGYHLRNVNYGRDYSASIVTDLAAAREGDGCPECGTPLRTVRGVEVGNIFQLGTRYTEALGATFLDKDGQEKAVVMGSYGIGVGRLLACLAEAHHDEAGLRLPVTVAPYPVHLVLLTGKSATTETLAIADQLYADLTAAGLQPLYDDRDESPGIKFNDADLIGLPIRLTIADRALKAGGVEMKRRDQSEKEIVPLVEVIARVRAELSEMQRAVTAEK